MGWVSGWVGGWGIWGVLRSPVFKENRIRLYATHRPLKGVFLIKDVARFASVEGYLRLARFARFARSLRFRSLR